MKAGDMVKRWMGDNGNLLVTILLLAFILRLAWVLAVPTRPISDFHEFHRLAISLIDGQGYVSTSGEPTAYRPPGYPIFLTGIYSIFGVSDLAARLVNVLLGVLTCWLTYQLASELFDRRVGLVAGVLLALFPSMIAWTNILATENLYLPILLAAILFFLRAVKPTPIQWHWLIMSGMLLGIGVLIRPATILFPAILVLSLILRNPPILFTVQGIKQTGDTILIGLMLSFAMLAAVLPWTFRNDLVFNRFVLVATEGGITFLSGHNERALTNEYTLEGPVFTQLDIENLDEIDRDKRAYQLGFEFIQHNPGYELRLLVHKFNNFYKDDVSGLTYNDLSAIQPLPAWLVMTTKGVAQVYYVLIIALALASIFTRRLPDDRWFFLWVVFIFVWTGLHLVFYGKDRFRLPLHPAFVQFAALSLVTWWDKHHARGEKIS
jgi:4-amino-4-deoxy-L-arabinose transferase-like glycosyltransferase